jgi:valyl-tRNA synthetase
MDRYGTDAFRFSLAIFAAQGRDIILSEKRIEGYRAFCNKIWNATRFISMNLGQDFAPRDIAAKELAHFDRWILHRLNRTIETVNQGIREYRFNDAAQGLYEFWWHEVCDWYLELVKGRLYAKGDGSGDADTPRQVLFHVLKRSLQLLHPFMPFITEEIWHLFPAPGDGPIIVSRWPEPDPAFEFPEDADEAALFQEIVYRIRNVRGEMNVPPDRKARVICKTGNKKIRAILEREESQIMTLARVSELSIDPSYSPDRTDASAVMPELEIFLPMKDLIDFGKERARLEKELARVTAELEKVERKLGSPDFIGKAPAHVVEKEKGKRDEYGHLAGKLKESIANLG